ncbi:MAG: recombination protein O N-terminal domain-containing protein [Patescibacteria group bacterium]
MAEEYTQAFVLRKDVRNDKDSLYILYTQKLGKVSAIAKSARKVTSKLSGHLSPGRLVDVRLIDKGSFQLLDGLSRGNKCRELEVLRFLNFIESMTPYNQPDSHVWHIAKEVLERCQIEPVVYRELVGVMGFAPIQKGEALTCAKCKKKGAQVNHFYIPDIVLLCSNCVTGVRIDTNDLVKIS